MTPKLFLDVVAGIVSSRGEQYGSPAENMAEIAKRWSLTLRHPITAEQVCLCLIDLKLVRLAHNMHADSVQDIAGYAAVLNQVAYEKE